MPLNAMIGFSFSSSGVNRPIGWSAKRSATSKVEPPWHRAGGPALLKRTTKKDSTPKGAHTLRATTSSDTTDCASQIAVSMDRSNPRRPAKARPTLIHGSPLVSYTMFIPLTQHHFASASPVRRPFSPCLLKDVEPSSPKYLAAATCCSSTKDEDNYILAESGQNALPEAGLWNVH